MDFLEVYNGHDLTTLPSGVWGIKEPDFNWQGQPRRKGEPKEKFTFVLQPTLTKKTNYVLPIPVKRWRRPISISSSFQQSHLIEPLDDLDTAKASMIDLSRLIKLPFRGDRFWVCSYPTLPSFGQNHTVLPFSLPL